MANVSSEVDSVIGANVRIFLLARGESQTALGKNLGIQRATMSKKIHGTTCWTAADVMAAARFLNVPVGRLYDPDPVNRFNKDFAE